MAETSPVEPEGARSAELVAYRLQSDWTLAAVALALSLAAIVYEHVDPTTISGGYYVAGVAALFAVAIAKGVLVPRSVRVVVRVTPLELVIGDGAPVPFAEVSEAKIIPRQRGAVTVRLTFRDHSQELTMRAGDAARMLRLVGRAPGDRRTSFAIMPLYGTRFRAVFFPLGVLAFIGFHHSIQTFSDVGLILLFAVTPPSVLLVWVAGFLRGRVVVGSDGFTRRWFWSERFFPFAEIESVECAKVPFAVGAPDTFVKLRSGKTFALRAANTQWILTGRDDEARSLSTHVMTALERTKSVRGDTQTAAMLLASRAGDGKAWLAQIDGAVRGDATHYRVAALKQEELTGIARDAASCTATRVGAAVALLRVRVDGREVVRELADACAEPELRRALVSLSEGRTEEEIVEILEVARKWV